MSDHNRKAKECDEEKKRKRGGEWKAHVRENRSNLVFDYFGGHLKIEALLSLIAAPWH